MNYGRFFKLNQRTSKVVDGVAIFDYIDLPAFFGPSEENPITPKYPVSVVISTDAVHFRIHYALLRLGEMDSEYFFHLEDIPEQAKNYQDQATEFTTVHMEEVVMELPFTDTHKLEEKVKGVYTTLFPMPASGGRYLEKLIKARYGTHETTFVGNLYRKMHDEYDSMLSYSTLNVMEIHYGEQINLCNAKDENSIERFLRKLLLDFMFDLCHTDIFQLSHYYNQMFTGLMSDFYFSALAHKCEYYYQLCLAGEALHNARKPDKISEWATLYGKDLFDAEDRWIHDIMSPQAEHCFLPTEASSWFMHPEKEMQQMTLYNKQIKSLQNVDHMVRHEIIQTTSDLLKNLINTHDRTREEVSRWFLRRYDWSDVMRLHIHNSPLTGYIVTFLILAISISFAFLNPKSTIPAAIGLAIITAIIAFVRMFQRRDKIGKHLVACIHLLLPRLVASIATAWFTIGLGFDLIITFFNKPVSPLIIFFVIGVLLIFSTYKIEQVSPQISFYRKVGRAAQLIVFSYFISFSIGIVLVNYIGYPFLLHEECNQCVNNIVQYSLWGPLRLHVFRNFTVMFSFVAMFIGIFIQLIILDDNKQMTEL